MAEADFSKLLQAAEQMTTDLEGDDELPRVECSLGQVLEASQELYSRVIQSGANDIQAHLLLGSKGLDLQQISARLETLSSKRTLEPLQPIADSDVESFLRNERENAVLCLIEQVNKNSMQTTEDQKWEHMLSEWNHDKMKLMNAMIGPSQNWLDLKKIPEQPCIIDPPRKPGHSMLDDIEAAYARQLIQYNKTIIQGSKSRVPLYQKFAQTAEDFNDPKVKEMWEMVRTMAALPVLGRDEDPLKCRAHSDVRAALVARAKQYLENRYKHYMSDVVKAHPATAMRGGEPGTYPLVRSYVGLRLQGHGLQGLADGTIDERPLWPMVYYCLRAGDVHASLHCLRKAGREHEELINALEERARDPDKRLDEKLLTAVNFQYRIQVRNATDPYKRAVYCVVGGCDATDEHTEVARTADDYLWIKLNVVDPRTQQSDAFTYADLQKMVLEEYGETHYKANEKPLVYFQVLMLTGQFEPAIEFLSRIPRYQVHGVHMALALHDVSLLGTPRNVQAPLLCVDTDDPPPLRRLNVARLLLLYVRKFELTDPSEALHYYYFLRNLRDPSGKNLFVCCCTELALESRDYDLLFGSVLRQFDSHIDTTTIATNVAEQLVERGLFEDAITVYEIAGNMEKVVELLCVLLAQVVSASSGGALRKRLTERANHVADRLRLADSPAPPQNLVHAFHTLTRLATFFTQYHDEDYDSALETLRSCELIPLSPEELEMRVTGAGAARGELLRCLPAVLRAVCSILLQKRRRLRDCPPSEQQAKQVEWLRRQAEVLNTFAGNIAYRMPGDTYSQLAQMQILMH